MAFDARIPEEQLKSEVGETVFFAYDCKRIIGRIDFAVYPHAASDVEEERVSPHLWAEAKRGRVGDAKLDEALVQLLLTVGRARTFDRHTPPKYLGAFDCARIVLLPYVAVQEVFYQNDFNWNVAPSDHGSREFRQLMGLVVSTLEGEGLRFDLSPERGGPLSLFIERNFNAAQRRALLQIDRNNFISVYARWREAVQPTIAVRWEEVKGYGIIDADFFLADMLSRDSSSLLDKLNVLLQVDRYRLNRGRDVTGGRLYTDVDFNDGGRAHGEFWRVYERPPDEVYWDYILERRDLLVPQDVRERKGSFFTPQIWVEKSQEYLRRALGRGWQDEYYVWDCAAGTGNLLVGLTNRYNVYASTLDQADVDVMHERIANGANLLAANVFQFDFLNDGWDKLPDDLRAIVEDPERRRRLVVYINPPYAEGDARVGYGRQGVHLSAAHGRYGGQMGRAARELFAQFLMRVHIELSGCILAQFSKLKHLQSPNFAAFRQHFTPALRSMFIIPANTFDNVSGQFPIAFCVWDTGERRVFSYREAHVYDRDGVRLPNKRVRAHDGDRLISQWLERYGLPGDYPPVGQLISVGNDFQNNGVLFIDNVEKGRRGGGRRTVVSYGNVRVVCMYFAVRLCMPMSWLNDRDQFLWPRGAALEDDVFASDCLAFTLLHGKLNVSAGVGTNYWIPFGEEAVNARSRYASHFMVDYLAGRLPIRMNGVLLDEGLPQGGKVRFSEEAQALMDAGLVLWRYYHAQPGADVNASYYDIRRHFQGVNAQGRMNAKSEDGEYMRLVGEVRERRRVLGERIVAKVYAYGFLMG